MAKTYAEKLQDPRWQKKRLQILQRDGFACQRCGSTDKTLHVHHGSYARGLDPWDYSDWSLWTLCYECHDFIGNKLAEIHEAIGMIHPSSDAALDAVYAVACDGIALQAQETQG